jgi:CRP/FNR family cyclic AMP-dependent transcriptional regulator
LPDGQEFAIIQTGKSGSEAEKRRKVMPTKQEFLNTIPYFAGLGESGINSIHRRVYEKKAGRGELLLTEGRQADALYFVVEGVVKVFKTSADGKEQILRIIRPGESFNDVAVLNGGDSLVSAAAMGPVVLYAIKKSDLENIMREYPQVAFNVIKVLSRRVAELIELVEDLSFRHVTGRVAKMLLEYAGDKTGGIPRLTQQEMAAMIGTAREMVGRSLKSLEGDGLIRMEHNRIIITNQPALRETAGIV